MAMRNPVLLQPVNRLNWRAYARLMRLHRPIGTLLLLWPTLWALWLAADGMPDPFVLIVFVLGTFLMRSAGCVINDYADRDFDGHVRRTRDRPLAVGEVEPQHALILFVVLVLVAGLLVLTQNWLTVTLAFAAVALASAYPFMKRYTYLPQVYLGLAFGWGIPMAFAAVRGEVPPIAWVLYVANLFWTTAYDTWYAMVDREDDLRAGSKSTAILFGDLDLVALGVLYALFFLGLWFVGRQADLGIAYWIGCGVALALVIYQFAIGRCREREWCFRAFLNNHWVGMSVFAGLAIALRMKG